MILPPGPAVYRAALAARARFEANFTVENTDVVAVAQVSWSALLIHFSGGRIETHFHIFGSLAILAFYRDLKVLIPATLVVAADHFVRGVYWPESI